MNIRELKGIGENRARLFLKKGIETTEDLLYFFPRDYQDRGYQKDIIDCYPGEELLIRATVIKPITETRVRKNMVIYSMVVGDETGIMSVIWYNTRFVKSIFKKGDSYYFFGKINPHSKKREMVAPIYEQVGREKLVGKIVPIYPLWQNLTQKLISNLMLEAIKAMGEIEEYIPQEILDKYSLCGINYAIKNIHFPDTFDAFETARKRLVFEEFLIMQLPLLAKRSMQKKVKGCEFKDTSCINEFLKTLPYSLTNAQKRVLDELLEDLKKPVAMNRLIQGDVGSGKTVVAAAMMYVAYKNGYQSIIMAPTEILAAQHHESFLEFFKNTGIKICLLTSSTKKKKQLHEAVKNGGYDIIIGTNAVISEGVEYKKLGLVIADEQHRFGVVQRAKLTNKGEGVHTIVMSATPIPRTLALILYADLDVSQIDELPPGRKAVKTYAVGEDMRERIYKFIDKNLQEKTQCYVVCPLVEESQKLDVENAEELSRKMQKLFPHYRVGLVHGKMKQTDKDNAMQAFAKGETDILVSTTVIEVGVNVANANLMIIENAERFGLSQLHQLRGRVGRGREQAFCIMFAHGENKVTKKRMETMCQSNDGFFIASEDLKLRGPGDFFGTMQHGLPELKIANLFTDTKILKQARGACEQIIAEDKNLSEDKYKGLYKKVQKMFREDIASN